MPSFNTHLSLPPGVLSGETLHAFFRLIFEEYRWFEPRRYGFAYPDEKLDPKHIDYDAIVAAYDPVKSITVAARTDRDYVLVHPAKSDDPPYTGAIIWATSVTETKKPAWRAAHLRQVHELMRRLGSPLAWAGPREDIHRKTQRIVRDPEGVGEEHTYVLRDPSEGLTGLFWRNFFGPPFVRLFGERLDSLPEDTRQDLGGGIVLVQPYALPTQAGTPEGDARERQLITQLGPECFYDHERHTRPTRIPVLSPTAA